MRNITLDFPTHSLSIYEAESGFIKASNIVKSQVYHNMIDAILRQNTGNANLYFVGEERKVLNNFVKSLVAFNNSADNFHSRLYPMFSFSDELQYQVFCLINDVPFYEQEWFKAIYIKTSFLNAISLFKDASTKLVERLYPSYFSLPENIIETLFRKYEANKALFKCSFKDIEQFLTDNDIQCLYHFTSSCNLNSIKVNGICSLSLLRQMNIPVEFGSTVSSRIIDKSKSLDNFVHLSYEQNCPMLYVALAEGRLSDYTILRVSPEVIILKSTKFSDINAASSSAKISNEISFFLNLNFNSLPLPKFGVISHVREITFLSPSGGGRHAAGAA